MKAVRALIFFLLAIFILSGCIVQSFYPYFTDKNKIEIPEAVKGEWKLLKTWDCPTSSTERTKGKDLTNISPWIFNDNELIAYDEDNLSGKFKITFFRVGGNLYCDTCPEPLDERKVNQYWLNHVMPVHLLCKVIIEKDILTLLPLDYGWMSNAIKNKALNLEHLEHYKENDWFLFTSQPEGWEKFLEQHGNNEKAFPPKLAFELKKLGLKTESK